MNGPALHDYAGAIHLHSVYSHDGRVPLTEILAAANRRGCDFLLLTDHSHLQAREAGWEGWHGRTLLIVGEEIAPRFNHYLAFGHAAAIGTTDLAPQACIDRVLERGGIGFIAHPDHRGAPLFHVKQFPWQAWDVRDYTGLSLWDFMTDWQQSLTGFGRAFLSYLFPLLFLRGPEAETLARWDRLTQARRVVGIAELDNHATARRIAGVTLSVFPFRRVLGLLRTHVLAPPLSGEASRDQATLLDALREGRAYLALDGLRPATGFSFSLREGERQATLGESFVLQKRALLEARLPWPARLRLLRNGRPCHEGWGREMSLTVQEPGVYRLEAYLQRFGRLRPWIFANPIHVTVEGVS